MTSYTVFHVRAIDFQYAASVNILLTERVRAVPSSGRIDRGITRSIQQDPCGTNGRG